METSGEIPSPRHSHASTVVNDDLWLYGGCLDFFLNLNNILLKITHNSTKYMLAVLKAENNHS